MERLPIEEVMPDLRRACHAHRSVVLTAPPGAGKTTQVPLALRSEPWLTGRKILLLEPRRLAARAAARYMAQLLGERTGQTVGYRMRFDTLIGPTTTIEVVTDGILTRLLQRDPSLADYGLVIFDEFHERSLQGDVGLALTRESQKLFRPDLRLVIMSATLDASELTRVFDGAPVIASEGRLYPVATRYVEHPIRGPVEAEVAQTIRRALIHESGSMLVFLPGMAEIHRVARRLEEYRLDASITVFPLHGDLPAGMQEHAIRPPPPSRRKIVLATSIAETSLTIEGVRVVVDAGLMRVPRYDPRTGLTRLDTVRVTHDAAEQRRGRAGRLEPGVCYRLWTEADHATLLPRRQPEIRDADLTSVALDLAVWGADDPSGLTWLDPPPAAAWTQAKTLLMELGAWQEPGGLTEHGRRVAELPLHPRVAHMLLRAAELGLGSLGCDIAALISDRDVLQPVSSPRHVDLRLRIDALHGRTGHVRGAVIDYSAVRRIERLSAQWRRQLKIENIPAGTAEQAGVLLSLAYPDRIAQRHIGPEPRFRMANGRGARLFPDDLLAQADYLVAAQIDDREQWPRIRVAAPITLEEVTQYHGDRIHSVDLVTWDDVAHAVSARRQRRLGALVLEDNPLPDPDAEQVTQALLSGIQRLGLSCLSWTVQQRQWQARVSLLRRLDGEDSGWPDVSDQALSVTLEQWLAPFIAGMTQLAQVRKVDLREPLETLLTWEQRRRLDRLAPTHLTVPSGSHVRLDYEAGKQPVLSVKLQEMFGARETPTVCGGKLRVMLHLLSPAGRPVQVTQDLANFWASTYQTVKKELRGRYPKHPWPDDPLSAAPTKRTKRP